MNNVTEGTVASTLDICRNLPMEPFPKLPREQLFDLINKALSNNRIVVLEGEPLSGKSECLAELMRRSPNNSIGVFLNRDLGIFHSPSYLQLVVAEQVKWILDGVVLSDDVVTEEYYRQLIYRLQRKAKNTTIRWVVDGLFDGLRTPELNSLIKLIPFGFKDFEFVVTAESDISTSLSLKYQGHKSAPVIPIGLEEATSFFSDLNLDESVIHELRHFSGGNIGRMQKLRSFVRTGLSFEELLAEHSPSLETLFEFEWRAMNASEIIAKILAYVVFSSKPATLDDISRFVEMPAGDVLSEIESCRLLSYSKSNSIVSVESKAQRTFIRNRLMSFEAAVRSYIITSLLATKDSREATLYLPSELLSAGKHDELIEHLGPKHFLNLLATERSLHSIRYHAGLGIEAARNRSNTTAELALSLIRSAATGLEFSIGFDSKIEALIRLGSSEQALELASMAATAEERLHMLSIAVKGLHQNSQGVPAELKDQIRLLVADLSTEDLGDLGIEIACNLLPVDFDLAAGITRDVIDSAKNRIESTQEDKSANELPSSMRSSIEGDSEVKRTLDLIPQEQARKFADAVASTVDKFSAERITQFIKPLEASNKIMVLSRWLGQNKMDSHAYKIAEQALDIILSEVSRSPRLQDLREIAEILPFLPDHAQRDALTNRIEAQIALLGHHGTSEEYIRLWLLIYRVRFRVSPTDTILSVIDLFSEIDELKEVSVQVTCWTWMLFQLNQFDGLDKMEMDVPLKADVTLKLSNSIDKLLYNTANHSAVFRTSIAALAQTNMDDAVALVGRLNTQTSRDSSYADLVRYVQFDSNVRHSLKIVADCLSKISDDSLRSRAICTLLGNILRNWHKKVNVPVIDLVEDLWRNIRVAPGKLQANVLTSRIKLIEQPDAVDIESMKEMHLDLWRQVLGDTVKIEVGYWIASEFSADQPTLARDWLTHIVDFERTVNAASESVNSALSSTLSLATRVMPYMQISDDDFSRIRSLINQVSEPEVQLQLWVRLGIRLFFSGKDSIAKRIVSEHVEPLINQSYPNNELVLDSMISNAAPLMYLVHPATANQAVAKICCKTRKELARVNICDVLLTKNPIGEPLDVRNSFEFVINSTTVNDILFVLNGICTDSALAYVIEDLSSSIAADKNKSHLTRTSAINHLNSLQELVEAKLPDINNIKHNGYLIACSAYILRAKSKVSSANVRRNEWLDLYTQARAISNVADRVVVTAMVGACAVAGKAGSEVISWTNDIRSDLAEIPSDQDRVDRHDWVARIVGTADKGACRALISDALSVIVQLPETDDLLRRQRSLLDLANSLDPKLGDKLIAVNDTDEARKERMKVERNRQQHRLTLARNPGADEIGELSDHELADVCWDNLSRLNADRISARSIGEFRAFQSRASKMSIKSASAVWHFVIESSLRKRKSDKNSDFAYHLFDATCKASEVVCGLIGSSSSGLFATRTLESGIIRNGDRERFLDHVGIWAKEQSNSVVRISDPYFGPSEIELIRLIATNSANVKFKILTSKEHIRKLNLNDVAEAFEQAWLEISDDFIPEITISVIGVGNIGKHPIHDRWMVSEKGGLRLGTSSNSMGGMRTSEVTNLTADEAADRIIEIDRFLDHPPREIHGEKLSIAQYSL